MIVLLFLPIDNRRAQLPLTPEQYRKAIYLDFEGGGMQHDGTTPQPHMAGFFRPNPTGKSGKYNCIFFKEEWKLVSNGIRTAECETFESCFESLAKELLGKDIYLVYWTDQERAILQNYLSAELYNRLTPKLHNVKIPAKRYLKIRGLMEDLDITLENVYAALYPNRQSQPKLSKSVPDLCQRIDEACTKHKGWKHFSDKQKDYVKDLVAYNLGDCRSTWLIALKVGNSNKKHVS